MSAAVPTTRERVVDAAVRLTAQIGWSQVTMARLAEEVGVSRQTVYNEVGTKPGLAEAMRLVNPLGRLSRGAAGTVGTTLVLNTPGSSSGCVECLEAVIDVVPHAVRLLVDNADPHPGH